MAPRVGTVLCHLTPCVPQGDLSHGLVGLHLGREGRRQVRRPAGQGRSAPRGSLGVMRKLERERAPGGVTWPTAGLSIRWPWGGEDFRRWK